MSMRTWNHEAEQVHVPSIAEKMEYSLEVTPDTVCVSMTFPCTPFFVVSSVRWYVKVNGGSPTSVNTISA